MCLTPAQKRVAQLLGPQGLEIPKRGAAQLQQVLQGLGVHFRILADDVHAAQAARELPTEHRLRAELQPVGDGLQLRLVAAPYGEAYATDGPRLIPGQGRTRLVTTLRGEALGVQRDLAREREHLLGLIDTCAMLAEPADGAPLRMADRPARRRADPAGAPCTSTTPWPGWNWPAGPPGARRGGRTATVDAQGADQAKTGWACKASSRSMKNWW